MLVISTIVILKQMMNNKQRHIEPGLLNLLQSIEGRFNDRNKDKTRVKQLM